MPNLEAPQANIDLQHKLGLLRASIAVYKHADLSIVKAADARLPSQ